MISLTLFTAPKAFGDQRVQVIQSNAITSWRRLGSVEVILLGDETGIAEAATDLGVRHLKGVRTNESGTPLISSMVDLARRHARSELLCLINADMILMHDALEAAVCVQGLGRDFVLLSQRWDLSVNGSLEFSDGWEERLRAEARVHGQLHRPAGSDFFIFPTSSYDLIPDFAVGRAGWDNWMIYEARRQRWLVVDCTPSVMAIHQNHDYSHLPGGVPHYGAPETKENVRLAGGPGVIRHTILDATHLLVEGKLARPPLTSPRLVRKLERILRRFFFFLSPKALEEVARPRRWKKRILKALGRRPSGGVDLPN